MLRGLATVTLWADDVAEAASWYGQLLGVEPYYAQPGPPAAPAYVEFRLGDYQHELGFIDRRYAPAGTATGAPGGAVVYWHVDNAADTLERLLEHGAEPHEALTSRGEGTGFVTASVVDPFGNVLGIMQNPHYLDVLASR